MSPNEAFALLCGVVVCLCVIGLAVRKDFNWFKADDGWREQEASEAQERYIHDAIHRIDRAANRPRRVK